MGNSTLELLTWLSETEAQAVREIATALRASCGGPAILTVRDDSGAADVSYSRPVSLSILAQ